MPPSEEVQKFRAALMDAERECAHLEAERDWQRGVIEEAYHYVKSGDPVAAQLCLGDALKAGSKADGPLNHAEAADAD